MSNSTTIEQLPTDVRCYRLQRCYLLIGVVCGVFFAGMGIASVIAALWNIDGSFARPKLAAFILGIGWSGFTILAIWLVAAYFRERLFLGKAAIIVQGIFRAKSFPLEEVSQIKWRAWPVGGSVVIRTHCEKAVIHLANFTRSEIEELIRFLRESFAVEIQENWSRFEEARGMGRRTNG